MLRFTLSRRLRGLRAPVTSRPRRRPCPIDAVAELDARVLLSVTIQIDYSYDTANFFNTQAKRDLMQLAANNLASALNDSLSAITPSGGNTWTASFPDPANTALTRSIPNLVVPANTLILFVGGGPLSGSSEAAEGSTGGYNASGNPSWLDTVAGRGQPGALASPATDFAPWGGSISFDSTSGTNWFFGQTTAGLDSSETDFLSVAEHEVAHVLGIGTADSWYAKISGGKFYGTSSMAVYGGVGVPLDSGNDHWAQSVVIGGQPALMTPVLTNGDRGLATTIDFAALADVGWQVAAATPGAVQFSGSSYSTVEGLGVVTITVTRTGGSGAFSVNYSTTNGTALAGSDYSASAGTLNFAAGDTTKTFNVTVTNDGINESPETFTVRLTSPTGGATLGSPSTATVTISDPGTNRAPVDFDGDGRTDRSVFRVGSAQWFSIGTTFQAMSSFGATNLFDIPVPGDYDGDGRAERAVFRPSTAEWFVLGPSGGYRLGTFGATNLFDIPAPGDYDGDGRTEMAVFRPSTSQWFALGAAGGRLVGTFGGPNFMDLPVPGDYDGDGRTEPAVFRPATSQWFAMGTSGTNVLGSFGGPNYMDVPTPGDYDGDGREEPAVFRAATGEWFAKSGSGTTVLGSFGGPNYMDVPGQTSVGSLSRLGIGGLRTSGALSARSSARYTKSADDLTPVSPPEISSTTTPSWPRRGRARQDSAWLTVIEQLLNERRGRG